MGECKALVVCPEYQGNAQSLYIVYLESIARGAHLLPVYGTGFLPEDFHYTASLDAFRSYFLNSSIDHHIMPMNFNFVDTYLYRLVHRR